MSRFLFICMLLSTSAMANTYHQVGRYSETVVAPNAYQQDPLKQLVDISFPPQIQNVHQALSFVLGPTGYSLPTDFSWLDEKLIVVGKQKLPNSQRKIRGSVSQVVRTLVGRDFVVVRDDVNRLLVLDFIGRE